jgi:hypothetical protein
MIQPQSLCVLPGGHADGMNVWAIQGRSGKYLAIPDARFPGRRPIRFFSSEVGAGRVLKTILELKPSLEKEQLVIVEVSLLDALRRANTDRSHPLADSFVINNPDEVFELVTHLRQKAKEKESCTA